MDSDEEEKTEFTFDELDDAAKEKARDWWREIDDSYEWWDYTYEDAVTIGKLIGIEIGMRSMRTVGNTTVYEPDIYFRLHVQGSGACYSGQLVVKDLKGAVARLSEHVGNSEPVSDGNSALHALAKEAEALYDQIALYAFTRRLMGPQEPDRDRPWGEFDEIGLHESLAIEAKERHYRTCLAENNYPEQLVELINAYIDGYADWIYRSLDDESMYRYSEEYVDEAIRNNETSFDAYGRPV